MNNNVNFYPDNCPPDDAECHDGYVYLFVRNNPPQVMDTDTAYDKGTYLKKDPCQRRSISCGIDITYLDSMQDLFPVRKGWHRAQALIQDCTVGVLKQTNSNLLHYSLWLDTSIKSTFYKKLEIF